MLDFFRVSTRSTKKGTVEIYPKFIVRPSSDLMIRGSAFYAIWDESAQTWSTKEETALQLIDQEIAKAYNDRKANTEDTVRALYLWDAESGMIDRWHKYIQKQMWDNYHELDERLIFTNTRTSKTDYASKSLPYALEKCDIPAYEELISTLYDPTERHKIEWAIGSIVAGKSVDIQKFIVMYGAAGTGKSTILNIIQDLFEGYWSVFDARALGSSSNSFALEAFRSNPLVAIQHDGDLSRIEDNTRLNSVVSHEMMTVNEKFKSTYSSRFRCFLFMGTNKPVKITDARSGILRRLIDVSPSGKKLKPSKYWDIMSRIKFELGGIAYHCKEVYLENPGAYDDYVPTSMMSASNDFYNYVLDSYEVFKASDQTTLKAAWEMYKQFCDEARVPYPLSYRLFKEELKNYFKTFEERARVDGDTRVRNLYSGFISDKFEYEIFEDIEKEPPSIGWITFKKQESKFDIMCAGFQAQYASERGTPLKKWDEVATTLSELDTYELHYVLFPKEHVNHIVIDFDIPDEDGNKSLERNLEAANKFPPTYAELSKSGAGIHLHYIYVGDPSKLRRVYADHVEIKVFAGKMSLRRKLTKCNNLEIAPISSGLPLKEEKKTVNAKALKSEAAIRRLIERNLRKEIHPGTKPSVEFIKTILDQAYESDIPYDVSDMRGSILEFASRSTNHPKYCIRLVSRMPFTSKEPSVPDEAEKDYIIFFDIEVFPNLFLVNWKVEGEHNKVIRMINPTPAQISELVRFKLVGFNCRRYDNHILYGRLLGLTNEQLYELSQAIISGRPNAMYGEAYNISYTDVYDFCSKKQSLKKWEIELGIHHQELGLPWDQPVPEEKWQAVAAYCDNDVLATEAVFNARKGDFIAREILAEVAGGSVNDTTNSLTAKIIFGNNKHPQSSFNYRNLAEPVPGEGFERDGVFSAKPFFPGYVMDGGVSTYRGLEVGEGGFVWSQPGMYWGKIYTFDVASMHPSSVIAENLFGDYTKNFEEIKQARVAIKHHDFESAKHLLGGKLAKYLDESQAKSLSQALKIAINSVYGLTAASFDNPFRDVRNRDNIVAKRGALFMIDLLKAVQDIGGEVIHIKTDSIKIVNPSDEVCALVYSMGEKYGYTFEVEHIFSRICLVNDAVFIAKCTDDPENEDLAGKWTATGTQFQVPYVFKTLFSREPIKFEDTCETKSVSTAIYLDRNEGLGEDEHNYIFIGKVGQFTPVVEGCGGGILLRISKEGDKYGAVGGSKGYRWLESEFVRSTNREDCVDISYYAQLVDDAVATINNYGDFEEFAYCD